MGKGPCSSILSRMRPEQEHQAEIRQGRNRDTIPIQDSRVQERHRSRCEEASQECPESAFEKDKGKEKMIELYHLDKKLKRADIKQLHKLKKQKIWFDITDITKDEASLLEKEFDLHHLTTEDLLN